MSIRGFHLFFISLASVFCALVAIWAFVVGADDVLLKVVGGLCALAALVLPVYGVYFYRKAKNLLI
jgi:type IV secretory pathway TrbL component